MREISDRLVREHGPLRIAMHHRVGDLAIGEVAVIVAAAAPHRDEAIAAARAAIDELKSIVPIWKKEHAEDGAIWIEEHDLPRIRAPRQTTTHVLARQQ